VTATINTAWYDLFSRGARDWLRHNDKVREAVQNHLPDLIAGPDLITGPQERTVQVPVRMLEHARFRLAEGRSQTGAGQGEGAPGDLLQPAQPGPSAGGQHGEGGGEDGEVRAAAGVLHRRRHGLAVGRTQAARPPAQGQPQD
jgi:uncharacterized sporulation protein YeaH/YhbH (DUF444 family)